MDDWKRATAFLKELVSDLDPNRSVVERAALLGGATALLDALHQIVKDRFNNYAYAQEKISNTRWHIAAALGLDTTNDHGPEQHRSWALGDLGSLESVLGRISPQE